MLFACERFDGLDQAWLVADDAAFSRNRLGCECEITSDLK